MLNNLKKEDMLRQECKISCNSYNFRRVFGNSYFFRCVCQITYKQPEQKSGANLHERRGCLICVARISKGSGLVGAVGPGQAGQGRAGQGRAGPGQARRGLGREVRVGLDRLLPGCWAGWAGWAG